MGRPYLHISGANGLHQSRFLYDKTFPCWNSGCEHFTIKVYVELNCIFSQSDINPICKGCGVQPDSARGSAAPIMQLIKSLHSRPAP